MCVRLPRRVNEIRTAYAHNVCVVLNNNNSEIRTWHNMHLAVVLQKRKKTFQTCIICTHLYEWSYWVHAFGAFVCLFLTFRHTFWQLISMSPNKFSNYKISPFIFHGLLFLSPYTRADVPSPVFLPLKSTYKSTDYYYVMHNDVYLFLLDVCLLLNKKKVHGSLLCCWNSTEFHAFLQNGFLPKHFTFFSGKI